MQYLAIRHLFLGDYYPLDRVPARHEMRGLACQHDRADLGEGLVIALKRPHSPFDTACLILHGLNPKDEYEVTNLDTGEAQCFQGVTLMERGLEVYLPDKPDSGVDRIPRAAPTLRGKMTASSA